MGPPESGGIFRSSDNGGSWETVNTGLPHSYFYAQELLAGSDSLVLLGTGGLLFRSTDGGAAWSAVAGVQDISVMSVMPHGEMHAGDSHVGALYRSRDAGLTWASAVVKIVEQEKPKPLPWWQSVLPGWLKREDSRQKADLLEEDPEITDPVHS